MKVSLSKKSIDAIAERVVDLLDDAAFAEPQEERSEPVVAPAPAPVPSLTVGEKINIALKSALDDYVSGRARYRSTQEGADTIMAIVLGNLPEWDRRAAGDVLNKRVV